MSSPKMSFGSLPKESSGNIQPGIHKVKIMTAVKDTSKKGKPMLTLQIAPVHAAKLLIYDRITLFDQNYNPEAFGQYKLRKLLEATQYIPKQNFTIETLAEMLPGREFQVELVHQEGNGGKKYLEPGDIETYKPIEEDSTKVEEEEETPAEAADEQDLSSIEAELEDDDEVV